MPPPLHPVPQAQLAASSSLLAQINKVPTVHAQDAYLGMYPVMGRYADQRRAISLFLAAPFSTLAVIYK